MYCFLIIIFIFFQFNRQHIIIPESEVCKLSLALSLRNSEVLTDAIWESSLRDLLKKKYLLDVAAQCENLGKTAKGGKPTVLKDKSYEALKTFSWLKILEEGQKRCPDVIDFIATTCAPAHRESVNKTKKGESRIPAIGLAYAVMMHQANQQLSLVQRMNTMILCHGHAEKMVSIFMFKCRGIFKMLFYFISQT